MAVSPPASGPAQATNNSGRFPKRTSFHGVKFLQRSLSDGSVDATSRNATLEYQPTLLTLLKPVLCLFKLFGLYHSPPFPHPDGTARLFSLGRLFNLLTGTIVISNIALRLWTTYFELNLNDSNTPIKLSLVLFWVHVTANYVHCLSMSFHTTGLRKACDIYNSMAHSGRVIKYIRMWTLLLLLEVFLLIFVQSSIVGCTWLFNTDARPIMDSVLLPSFLPSRIGTIPAKIICFGLYFLSSAMYILPLVLFKLLCIITYFGFSSINTRIKYVLQDRSMQEQHLSALLTEHRHVEEFAKGVGEIHQQFLNISFISSIVTILMCSHQLLRVAMQVHDFWLAGTLCGLAGYYLISILLAASLVHWKAHAPAFSLCDIHLVDDKIDLIMDKLQILLFLQRVQLKPIGFNISGLWMIKKTTCITVIGFMVVFMFLLAELRFAPS